MTQWQFLIRKEGDQDWLPLESYSAEILEGRYQLVVQCHQSGADIEVQIRHEYEMGGILQEVTQRRRQTVDVLGYLDLMASTYLPPGLWEIKCRTVQDRQEVSQNAGQEVSKQLILQVLAQDFDLCAEWDSPSKPEASTTTMPPQEKILPKHPQPTSQVPSSPKSGTASAATQKSTPVALPIISQDAVPLVLQPVSGLRLPPMIYTPSDQDTISPQLPAFLPLANLDCIPESVVPTSEYLEFLRSVARSIDRHAVQAAFESLEWPQRFLSTLDTLAELEMEASRQVTVV